MLQSKSFYFDIVWDFFSTSKTHEKRHVLLYSVTESICVILEWNTHFCYADTVYFNFFVSYSIYFTFCEFAGLYTTPNRFVITQKYCQIQSAIYGLTCLVLTTPVFSGSDLSYGSGFPWKMNFLLRKSYQNPIESISFPIINPFRSNIENISLLILFHFVFFINEICWQWIFVFDIEWQVNIETNFNWNAQHSWTQWDIRLVSWGISIGMC